MESLYLVYDIPPSLNQYLNYHATMRNGRPRCQTHKTQEVNRFQHRFSRYVRQAVREQGWNRAPDKTQHFYVDAYFYFARINTDASNHWKALLDAITETQLIWLDDNVVCERVQRIYYDAENPRVELTIYPVDYIGIFDNEPELAAFEANCIGCRRYDRNCSLLRGAKTGRIQREIVDKKCLKFKPKSTGFPDPGIVFQKEENGAD